MTQPTTEEPISVRIARLKGCEHGGQPVCPLDDCPGWAHLPPRMEHGMMIQWPAIPPDYLAPAASFALLAEMVEGPFQDDEEPIDGADVAIGKHGKLGYWFAANDGLNNQKASQLAYVSRVPTLGEAIALAYEAWATAKAARQ